LVEEVDHAHVVVDVEVVKKRLANLKEKKIGLEFPALFSFFLTTVSLIIAVFPGGIHQN
jgi:hypothetical protein